MRTISLHHADPLRLHLAAYLPPPHTTQTFHDLELWWETIPVFICEFFFSIAREGFLNFRFRVKYILNVINLFLRIVLLSAKIKFV
jgi:hypothetical protein